MSRAAVRIHSSSRGRNVEDFKPGEDLVLEVDEAHGEELPQGVGVRDHLDLATRKDVDVLARDALALWRTNWDAALTVGGVCWPLVWEFEMFQSLFVPAVADAVGLDRALADCGCAAIELADDEPRTAADCSSSLK